jgi:hypothetical protein
MLFNPKRGGLVFTALLMFLGVSAFNKAKALPGPVDHGPEGVYTFPSTFKSFDVSDFSSDVAAGAPEIAEWTRSSEPGDSFALTGSHLSEYTGTSAGRDTYFHVFGQSNLGKVEDTVRIKRLDGAMAALALPATLPQQSMYLLWARNASGYSRPVAMNRTEAWWIGPSKVEQGAEFSLYGRNLQFADGKTHLYIEELDRWLESKWSN